MVNDGGETQKMQRLAPSGQNIASIPESDLKNELHDESPLINEGASKNDEQIHKLLQSMAANS